jgi:uncharacterized membrane protein
MNERTARLVVVGMVLLCCGVALYRWKNGGKSPTRTVVATTLLGGALYALAAPVPGISASVAALAVADVFVLEPSGNSFIDGVATAVTAPATATKVG